MITMRAFLLRFGTIASTVTLAIVLPAAAEAIALTQSSGTWVNPVGSEGTITYTTIETENQIRWGNPITSSSEKSGLGFAGFAAATFDLNTSFLVGTLRHFNNPVSNPIGVVGISAVDLLVNLDFADVGGVPLSRQFTFNFGVDETPNRGDVSSCFYPSTIACADKISFLNTYAAETFNIVGRDYTLKLLGFSNGTTPAGTLLDNFISQEQTTNVAYLYGEISAPPLPLTVPVPEPGAIGAFSLIGLYGLIRRCKTTPSNL
jgi:hypothetical protein